MLRRLRWKFIRITMGSMLAVFCFLLVAINLINYWQFLSSADAMLRLIGQNGGRLPNYGQILNGELRPEPQVLFNEETPFFTRFFAVIGEDQQVTDVWMEQIAAVTEDDAETYYQKAVDGGKTSGFVENFRYLVTRDGTTRQVIFLDCSRELQSQLTFVLISVSVAAVAYLAIFLLVYLLSRRAIRPIAQNFEQQKQFITDAGHELKTPLTIISTSADVLDAELPDNEWVSNIRRQAARMSGLITNLIMLSRMNEEGAPLQEDLFVLSEAVWDVAAQYQSMAEARGKELQLHIEDDVAFRGDAAAIQQMLSLLLDNAVQYADPGSVIVLRLRQERDVMLEISNRCTLPENLDPERLFDRFYRLDPARSQSSGGSGIGLSVARAIAERHGGTLRASVEPGGICMTALFPHRDG